MGIPVGITLYAPDQDAGPSSAGQSSFLVSDFPFALDFLTFASALALLLAGVAGFAFSVVVPV